MQYALALFTVFLIGVAGNVLEGAYILWPTLIGFALAFTRDWIKE